MAKISLTSGGRTVNGKKQVYDKNTKSYIDEPKFVSPQDKLPLPPGTFQAGQDGGKIGLQFEKIIEAGGQPTQEQVDEFGNSYSKDTSGDIVRKKGESDADYRERLLNSNFKLRGMSSGSSAVMTNANKIERVIPLLKSQANLLGAGNSNNATFGGDDTEGAYNEAETQDFDEILGLKKKKKKEELDPYSAQSLKLLEQMQKTNDRNSRAAITSIRQEIDNRQAQQQQANQSGLAQVRQALNLGGSSRYAPISSAAIVSAKEAQGIQALADLDVKEQSLIREIRQAQQTADFDIMEQKLGILEGVRREKAQKQTTLEEEMRTNTKRAKRENSIVDLYKQGITDVADIYDTINRDEEGNLVGDVSLEEIQSVLKIVNPPEDLAGLTADYRTYAYLKKIGDPSVEGLSYVQFTEAVANSKRKATGGGTGSGVYEPTGTDAVEFDYGKAKMADIKQRVKELFPLDFGTQLILELTDEELRAFMEDFEQAQIEEQMNIDPEQYFMQWAEQFTNNTKSSDDSMEAKINKLFAE